MSSREGQDDAVIGADLLAQLQDNATVLGVFSIALLGLAAWLAQRRRRVRVAAAEAADPLELD